MITVRTIADLRAVLDRHRRAGDTIGLVPTMGAFHAGHLALMTAARERCNVVVVSLFVNPSQFGAAEDLSAYPRDEQRDADLAAAQGTDILFAPSTDEVYPDGFATTVTLARVTGPLEGARRGREHFDGVATVVTKLFNMAQPDVAFFGQKDAQQALVIKRLVRDLDIPVEIDVRPTVREPDGLAMSSRNAYLDHADRTRAVALSRALQTAEQLVADGELDVRAIRAAAVATLAEHGVEEPEYFELVDAATLEPVERVEGDVLVAVAARVGPARLIDNTIVRAGNRAHRPGDPVTCNA
jgi:pantoate--beta-alanine ligase